MGQGCLVVGRSMASPVPPHHSSADVGTAFLRYLTRSPRPLLMHTCATNPSIGTGSLHASAYAAAPASCHTTSLHPPSAGSSTGSKGGTHTVGRSGPPCPLHKARSRMSQSLKVRTAMSVAGSGLVRLCDLNGWSAARRRSSTCAPKQRTSQAQTPTVTPSPKANAASPGMSHRPAHCRRTEPQ